MVTIWKLRAVANSVFDRARRTTFPYLKTPLLEKLNFKALSETQFQSSMIKMKLSWR
jgi:hypothetical protein